MIGGLPTIGFAAPWLLAALALLPILWLILRAVPPAPVRRRFPGVALLLGLEDRESTADRTPWWLLLLRMIALAAVIVGLAGPVLDPRAGAAGRAPLLVVMDAGWASAADWPARTDRVQDALREAGRAGRPVAVLTLTAPPPDGPSFRAADAALAAMPGVRPAPWAPRMDPALPEGAFDTLWITDGLEAEGRADLLAALEARGTVTLAQGAPRIALGPPAVADGALEVPVHRPGGGGAREVTVTAIGPDPSGAIRRLASGVATFEPGDAVAIAALDLPPELRNRVARFEVEGVRSAGAVQLADDRLRRREIALLGEEAGREGLRLLAPEHYLRQALAPNADLLDGEFADILPANPDVIVIADGGRLPEADALEEWTRAGGLLLRFAGPRLAASDVARGEDDPLMPVRLRAGGRTVGGAMSWGEPRSLRPFAADGPFAGLQVPEEVRVSAQVVAEPGPELAERTIAALDDGTPLVTRAALGDGQVVLFHVTANAEWSGLPLSGLFVDMLERLAVSTPGGAPPAEEMEGTLWTPDTLLGAFGEARPAGAMAAVPGEALAAFEPGPATPPGLYAGEARRLALNVVTEPPEAQAWPAGTVPGPLTVASERPLGGWFLAAALALLAADALASLAIGGRLRRGGAVAAILAAAMLPAGADAQEAGAPAEPPIEAVEEMTLAHVLTGDAAVDDLAAAGLRGLSRVLFQRTSVEPGPPRGVDPARDELSIYPLLYWPVTPDAQAPGPDARARLNAYLRGGGMIVFDTRDAGFPGGASPERRALQRIASGLDVPPLDRVPEDHVITRAFYLLQDFPGRHPRPEVWVEAAPPDAERAEGMPFRNLNDNVTPVLIGGGDWAAAWAEDEAGRPMLPIGRGFAGERQREIARRFGVNLVMHVLTGNYKSDQVHVPALLDRLGQ